MSGRLLQRSRGWGTANEREVVAEEPGVTNEREVVTEEPVLLMSLGLLMGIFPVYYTSPLLIFLPNLIFFPCGKVEKIVTKGSVKRKGKRNERNEGKENRI